MNTVKLCCEVRMLPAKKKQFAISSYTFRYPEFCLGGLRWAGCSVISLTEHRAVLELYGKC